MPIAMEQFGSHEQRWESGELGGIPRSAFPYCLQCRTCGFEPENAVTAPHRCPKCGGSAWERFALPASLLTTADRHASDPPARAVHMDRLPAHLSKQQQGVSHERRDQ
jgi:PHP family Zn ribbon phosphoesterase